MLKSFLTPLFALALVVLAGAVSAADKAPFRIAVIEPLSGSMAAIGQPYLAELQFDAALLNKEGGINGHKVEIIGMDNQVNVQESLVRLQKAINEGVRYIAQGGGSSVASAILNAVDKHNQRNPEDRVLFLNYGAVDPAFTNENCSFWHFRFDANADMKMKLMTDWVVQKKEIKKVFLFNQDYSLGHSVSKAARKMLKEKRPDIEIVGDVYVPLGKVKDFTPYVSKIKGSGAGAVITSNWGQDFVLLIKAAADYGLKLPFLSYYGNSPGTATQVGEKGVDLIYVISAINGDFDDPKMAKHQVEMYKEKGWDFVFGQLNHMMHMLKQAAEKADSIDPTKVAFALEGLQYETAAGPAMMRAEDHQILMPMFLTVYKGDMKYGAEDTNYNFHTVSKFPMDDMSMPTTCDMRRPKQ